MSLLHRAAANADGMERWRRFRARGQLHFVLVWGVLFWGGLMFLATGLGMPALQHGFGGFTPRLLLINAAVWLVGGLLFGLVMWRLSEKAFQTYESNRSRATP